MNRLIATFTASAGAALLLAACGGGDDAARDGAVERQADGTMPAAESMRATGERARPGEARPAARRATVKMGEWYFKIDRKRLRAGKVTLVARNDGQIVHELLVVRTNRPAHRIPMRGNGPDLERTGEVVVGEMHGHAGEEDGQHGDEMMSEAVEAGHLAGGESERYRVKLRRGKYVLLCSIPGHYKAGQYASLTVQ